MSTLRELLKDKTLPVKVQHSSFEKGEYLIVEATNSKYMLVRHVWRLAGKEDVYGLDFLPDSSWELYQEPRPKKKMYAYLQCYQKNNEYFWKLEYYETEKDNKDLSLRKRAPNLDTEVDG